MAALQHRNQAVHHQTYPEIDQEAKIGPQGKSPMPGSRRQVGHEKKVDSVARHHGRERNKKVPR